MHDTFKHVNCQLVILLIRITLAFNHYYPGRSTRYEKLESYFGVDL